MSSQALAAFRRASPRSRRPGAAPTSRSTFFNWPFLYDEKYIDVSDIADEVGKQQGGWYKSAKEACVVNGKWKAVPFGCVGQLMNWRMDSFKEVGFDKFPDSWDENSRGRHQAQGQGASIRLRTRPRLR